MTGHAAQLENEAGNAASLSRRAATYSMLVLEYAGLAVVFVRAIVIVPFCLRFVDITLYGAWLATGDILAWLTVASGGEVVRQQVATHYGRREYDALGAVIGSSLLVTGVYAGLAGLIALLAAPFVGGWLGLPAGPASELGASLRIVAVATALDLVAVSLRAVPQGLQRPTAVGVGLLACAVAEVVVTLALLSRGWGLMSLAAGVLLRNVLRLCVATGVSVFYVTHRFDIRVRAGRAHCRRLMPLIGWSTANNAGVVLGERADAVAIALILGPTAVAAAVLTKRTWDMLAVIVRLLGKSLTPAMAHLHGAGDLDRFQTVTGQVFGVILVITFTGAAVLWALNESFIRLWVGAHLYAGSNYDALLGAGIALGVTVFSSCQILFSAGGIKGASLIQLSQNALRVIVLVCALPLVGILAVPVSMILGHGLGGIRTLSRQWRLVIGSPTPLLSTMFARSTVLMIVGGVAAVICRTVVTPTTWTSLAVAAVALASFCFAAFLIFDRGTRAEMWRLVPAIRRSHARDSDVGSVLERGRLQVSAGPNTREEGR